jgi:NHL repeat
MRRFRFGIGIFFVPALVPVILLGACNAGTATNPLANGPVAGGSPLRAQSSSASKIYVANLGGDNITVYSLDGEPAMTITAGIVAPFGVAVDRAGKIYVTNTLPHTGGNVTTYAPDGKRTKPTITDGIAFPADIAVDNSGKIYVSNLNNYSGTGYVSTYKSDGTRTTPTITTGVEGPAGLTVDSSGKIYVANVYNGTVTTYNPDGSQTTPTITGLDSPYGVAVDANHSGGRRNLGFLSTFTADGGQTTPTISSGVVHPAGVAVDTTGTIYVANQEGPGDKGGFGSVTTYSADGKRTTPIITKGIGVPGFVTLH